MNQRNTLKRKEARKAQPLNLEKIDLESKIEIECCNDQADCQNKIFRTREFS